MPAPKKPAGLGRAIDLDARRKARAEVKQEPVTLVMGGKRFSLPAIMPAQFAMCSSEGDIRGAIAALLDEHVDAFYALKPTVPDIEDLLELAGEVYGVTPGEA